MTTENPNIGVASKGSFGVRSREIFFERRLPLARAVGERGARLVGLDGAEGRAGPEGMFKRIYTFDTGGFVERGGFTWVSSGLDATGGLARFTPEVPALNPMAVRAFGRHESTQAQLLRPVLGEAVPAGFLASPDEESIIDALDRVGSEKFVIKADFDPNLRRPWLVGSRADIEEQAGRFLKDNDGIGNLFVQEFMPEAEAPFNPDLDFSALEKSIQEANPGERKLRLYFVDGKLVTSFGRTSNEWVFFDPDSLPEPAANLGRAAANLIISTAGARDSLMAIDLTPDGQRLISVNTRNPGVMMPSQDRPAAQHAHETTTDAVADKLVAMANRERDE